MPASPWALRCGFSVVLSLDAGLVAVCRFVSGDGFLAGEAAGHEVGPPQNEITEWPSIHGSGGPDRWRRHCAAAAAFARFCRRLFLGPGSAQGCACWSGGAGHCPAHRGARSLLLLPECWAVERIYGRLVFDRRPARDCETLPACSEAMIRLAVTAPMACRLIGGATTCWCSAASEDQILLPGWDTGRQYPLVCFVARHVGAWGTAVSCAPGPGGFSRSGGWRRSASG